MISFRHHVVSLVAVFLALAAGVALGGGPLSDLGRTTEQAPATDTASAEEAARARAQAAFAGAVVEAGAARLYDDGLSGRSVALVSFPGVPDATLEALEEQVTTAGGTVSGRYAFTEAMVDPGEKALVDTLGSQLLTQLRDEDAGAALSDTAPTYERMGELVALAVATTDTRRKGTVGPLAASVTQSLSGAELMTSTGDPTVRAPYVLVVLGPDTDAAADPVYAGLVAGLARGAAGAVLAATASDGADGRLSRLRSEPVSASVATLDGVEAEAGRVSAVLALLGWPETKGGSFGASGADGAVPLR